MHELPLVLFTVIAQGTVGLFLVLGLLLMLNRDEQRGQLLSKLMIVVLGLLAVAGAAAMTHLGQPLRAMNVIFGLEHFSALSVEIMTTSLFGGAVFVYVAMSLMGILPKLQKLVLAAAMVIGVLLLLAIANVYTLATVPTWNSGWTVFQFVLPAAIVGLPAAAMLLRSQSEKLGKFQKNSDRALATTAMIALGVAVIGFSLYLFWLGQLHLPINPFSLMDYHGQLLLIRMVLLFLGLSCWIVSAMRGNNAHTGISAFSLVLVVGSEICGRIFFYDLHLFASGM
ncbi:dimethyl sulfoxide reductase anchor subunit [Endozoicomonas sp. Mp262]|uniref:dimethyl sulfoxide reductase anchor subunit family protein n=1 Tax=Endozoicomonas sp. Mp262 TaxID=2919499 RepID=UPI0021D8F4CD